MLNLKALSSLSSLEAPIKSIYMSQPLITFISPVITGVIIFVFGQIIMKCLIEPIYAQANVIGEIAYSLTMYSNLYGNAGVVKQEKMYEASESLRKCASQLLAKTYSLKLYWLWENFRIVPKFSSIDLAAQRLIALSNYLFNPEADIIKMCEWEREIKHLLRIYKKENE